MARKTKWILGAFGCVYAIYALLTGGLCVIAIRDFDGQRNVLLAEGLESDVYLSPKRTNLWLPFVVSYLDSRPPCSLRLQLWDRAKRFRSITVTEIHVKYSDGAVVQKTEVFSWTLEAKPPYPDRRWLSKEIPNVVQRHMDVIVSITGALKTENGEVVPFSVAETFQAESPRFYMTTLWKVLVYIT
jgi:hypothetical protein